MRHSSRVAVAVHVLTLLAASGEELVPSDAIAGSVNTNAAVIRRLLQALTRSGLVRTQLGPGGGATLAVPAHQITLRDVYDAVEPGALFRMPTAPPNPLCPIGRHVQPALERHLHRASDALARELSRSTIADLAVDVRAAARHAA
ncbi:MAG: Rrf2 family transcriptional regulator [Gemmatimonadaceae bacterium]|jgi:Rrf2 family protein|nr:Rrf2 family transcriptional regulator [Gemmatimonadaceae bacterium]